MSFEYRILVLLMIPITAPLFAQIKSTTGTINIDADADGNSEMVVTTSGVGIGTLTPQANLHVEGNTYVSNRLGIGMSSPQHGLDIQGTLAIVAQTITSNVTLSGNSSVVVDTETAGGNLTLSLPSASSVGGRRYTIKKKSSGNTITLYGGFDNKYEVIQMSNSTVGTPFIHLVSSSDTWWILGRSDLLSFIEVIAGDNLIAYWKFDEADVSGTAADSSANSYSGTYNGAMTNDDVVSGKKGNALDLDGSNDEIQVGDVNELDIDNRPFSITFWFKTSHTDWQSFVGKTNSSGGGGDGFLTYLGNSGGTVTFRTWFGKTTDGNIAGLQGTTDLDDGQWHFASMTYDGTTLKLYTDSDEEASGTLTFDAATSETLYIGRYGANASAFKPQGLIDDVRIYDFGLSAVQVDQIYNATR